MRSVSSAPARVLYYLSTNPGLPYLPNELSRILGIPRGTVKTALFRLKQRGLIDKYRRYEGDIPDRGRYYVNPHPRPKPDLELPITPKLHGINIHISEPQNESGYIYKPIKIYELLKSRLKNIEFEERKGYYLINEKFGRERTLRFTMYKKAKSLQIWLNCTNNPLTYDEYYTLNLFLHSLLGDIYEYSNPRVKQLGNNEDYELFGFSKGMKPVKLQFFNNQFLQIYDKHKLNSIRKEIHMYPEGGLDPNALGDALLDIQEKGNLLVNSTTNRELTWKVENLIKTVDQLKDENNELRSTVSKLTDVLTQFFKLQSTQKESSSYGGGGGVDHGGYKPPPEDPQSDFTGYG